MVERFNRTLKSKMWKVFTERKNHKYIDILDDLVNNYNNSFHNTIKMTPFEASKKENTLKVDRILNPIITKKEIIPKFKVGDKVRISKVKMIFDKGYLPNYTYEIFTVSEIKETNPITYKLKDYNNEEIKGSFYNQELTIYNKKDNVYEVEKILKTRYRNGKKEFLVKWKGYPQGDQLNNRAIMHLVSKNKAPAVNFISKIRHFSIYLPI
jgi:Chromo (CHRromatin Organisation MOdifier) domain